MRLNFSFIAQFNKNGTRDDNFKSSVVNKSPLLACVCSQCQASQDAHNMTPYHGLRTPRAFRLLELFLGSMDDPLVGHLRCYTVDDAAYHYEALS